MIKAKNYMPSDELAQFLRLAKARSWDFKQHHLCLRALFTINQYGDFYGSWPAMRPDFAKPANGSNIFLLDGPYGEESW